MKNLISFLGYGTLAAATVTFVLANSGFAQKSYTVKRTSTPPVIDGLLGDEEWDGVAMEGNWNMLRQSEQVIDQFGWTFAATWDSDNMYMLFTSEYDGWLRGVGSEYENQPCLLELLCGGSDFGGNPDSLNLYIDPNTNGDANTDPPDGYQITFGINEGTASYLEDAITNTFLFREAHVDTGYNNGGEWGKGEFDGQSLWSFVSNAGDNGAVIEMVFPWQTWDALDEQVKHPFAPENGDEWYFNAGVITSDRTNFLPIWNWNPSLSFVTRPDGVLAFSTELIGDNGLIGDFDNSGELDEPDVNLLSDAIIAAENDANYDLNGDNVVTTADLTVWVKELRKTYFGDANLDGEFNSADFVAAFQAGKYETGEAATWNQGDWNASGTFDTSDFVSAFQDGGYEQGPAGAVSAVPEPAGSSLLLLGLLGLIRRRQSKEASEPTTTL